MINKCLFPAAGYGTRFLPATKSVPKEMLPILTKPLLQYGVEEALGAGIRTMAIVTGRGKRAIEDHFDNAYELESQLTGTSKEHHLHEIKTIIEEFQMQCISGMMAARELWERALLSSLLSGAGTWVGLKESSKAITLCDSIQNFFWRVILKVPESS